MRGWVFSAVEMAEIIMYFQTTYDVLIEHFGEFQFAAVLKPYVSLIRYPRTS
jgi:hypothetical protein